MLIASADSLCKRARELLCAAIEDALMPDAELLALAVEGTLGWGVEDPGADLLEGRAQPSLAWAFATVQLLAELLELDRRKMREALGRARGRQATSAQRRQLVLACRATPALHRVAAATLVTVCRSAQSARQIRHTRKPANSAESVEKKSAENSSNTTTNNSKTTTTTTHKSATNSNNKNMTNANANANNCASAKLKLVAAVQGLLSATRAETGLEEQLRAMRLVLSALESPAITN
mmetsp:Transcript_39920/g.92528  ORF Transcript_39920/g.92528 Transcript_39920/m.92528 type:complete len:236 (-) Transcript_39920:8-715(-)